MIWTALTAWTASPVPSPSPGFDEELVTPGIWGFAITLAVMVAVVLLIIDMTRRIRRVNYRAQVRDQLAAEEAAASGEKPDREKPSAP